MNVGKFSIVVTCHGTQALGELPIIVGSLSQQFENVEGKTERGRPYRWKRGGYFNHYPMEILIASDGPYQGPDVSELPLPPFVARVIECEKNGGVGHHTRGEGISAASGDWIVLTNADNYFMLGWLHRVVSAIAENGGQQKVGLVYWDCISNLWGWRDFGGSRLRRGHIDLSCAAVRADIAKRIGFPFRNYDGDFDYIKGCADLAERLKLSVIPLPETLCVHN